MDNGPTSPLMAGKRTNGNITPYTGQRMKEQIKTLKDAITADAHREVRPTDQDRKGKNLSHFLASKKLALYPISAKAARDNEILARDKLALQQFTNRLDEVTNTRWYFMRISPNPNDLTDEEIYRFISHGDNSQQPDTHNSRYFIPSSHDTIFRCPICREPINRTRIRDFLYAHLKDIHVRKGIGFKVLILYKGVRFSTFRVN